MPHDRRAVRRDLFERFVRATTPMPLVELQAAVAAAVREAEGRKNRATTKQQRLGFTDEIRTYRSYCDAIAWLVLHPHAIRQLAERSGRAPALLGLGDTLDRCLEFSRITAYQGIPALVVDLTNILRVGDVIIVRDPEAPDLVEFKGDKLLFPLSLLGGQLPPPTFELVEPGQVIAGRMGRQVSVMRSISEYLRKGTGKVYGNPVQKIAIESSINPNYYWEELGRVVTDALANGRASVRLGERHWLLAVKEGLELEKDDEIARDLAQAKDVTVASHYRPLEETWPNISTPLNWPLPDEARFALMEGDVLVATLFDVTTLVGKGYRDAAIEAVRVNDEHLGPEAMRIRYAGQSYTISNRLLMETLYGFLHVSSMVQTVCEFLVKSIELQATQEAGPDK